MRKFFFLALTIVTIAANAQDSHNFPDCLRTSEYFKGGYHALVERMLLPQSTEDEYNDLRYGRIWGLIIRPSFSPEESIYCIKTGSGFKLVMRMPEKSIWSAARDKTHDRIRTTIPGIMMVRNNVRWEDIELDMKVQVKELDITSEQASVLSELFRMAINTSTSLMSSSGLDGETTVFFYDGCAAECWSPEEGKLKRLIDIRQAMHNAIDNNDNSIIEAVIPEAKALTLEFRELLPDWAKEYLKLTKE